MFPFLNGNNRFVKTELLYSYIYIEVIAFGSSVNRARQ